MFQNNTLFHFYGTKNSLSHFLFGKKFASHFSGIKAHCFFVNNKTHYFLSKKTHYDKHGKDDVLHAETPFLYRQNYPFYKKLPPIFAVIFYYAAFFLFYIRKTLRYKKYGIIKNTAL